MSIGIISGIVIALLVIGCFAWRRVAFENDNSKMGRIAIALALVFSVSFIIVPFSFHTVNTGEVAVVKHLGKAKEIKEPGLSFACWFTNKYVKYDTKVRGIYVETAAYSSDAQQMKLSISFQYQIRKDKVMEITEQYGSLDILDARIQSIVLEKAKSSMSTYTAMNIIENRSNLSPIVEEAVRKALGDKYYIDVVTIAITNIDFSDAFETAVENKMIAEQNKLKAEFDAESMVVSARATAEANELLERSLTDKILQEMYINKWDGKLPQVVSDGNAMFQVPIQ